MDVKTFVIISCIFGLSFTIVAAAEAAKADCAEYIAQRKAYSEEAGKKDSKPSKLKSIKKVMNKAQKKCLDDKDGDLEPDSGEKIDDIADRRLEVMRKKREAAADKLGLTCGPRVFKVKKSSLGSGGATNPSSRLYATTAGCADDDAGHILANSLGGKGGVRSKNIFPQSPKVNRGKYNKFEQRVKKWILACHTSEPAELKITLNCGDKFRPRRPTQVHYKVKARDPGNDCKWTTINWSFANPRSKNCDE